MSCGASYIRPMGAGAVAAAGLITLIKTLPTIFGALGAGLKNMGKKSAAEKSNMQRTQRDLPGWFVGGGSIALVLFIFLFLTFKPVPGAQTTLLSNLAASLLIVVFGFLFVTVSSRIVGLIGSSASPVSGMTIATLMATSAVFLVKGWTAPAYGRTGDYDWRDGMYRDLECRRYFAGSEDGLPDWCNALEAAAGGDDRGVCVNGL